MDEPTCAYIAGFLDGDGCILVQLKPRQGYRYGYQIKATVSFYQKRQGRHLLEWLQRQIGVGRIRDRKDGVSQYDIEGVAHVLCLLRAISPYLVAKRQQAQKVIKLLEAMQQNPKPSPEEFLRWAGLVESCQALNYSKKRRHTVEEVARFLSNKGVSHPRND